MSDKRSIWKWPERYIMIDDASSAGPVGSNVSREVAERIADKIARLHGEPEVYTKPPRETT